MKKILITLFLMLNIFYLVACGDNKNMYVETTTPNNELDFTNEVITTTPTIELEQPEVKLSNKTQEKNQQILENFNTFDQKTLDVSSNPEDCLVTLVVENNIGSGIIIDCRENKTYILTSHHIFWDTNISKDNTINVSIRFNDNENHTFLAKINKVKGLDANVVVIDYDITNNDYVSAVNLTTNLYFKDELFDVENFNSSFITYDCSLSNRPSHTLKPKTSMNLETLLFYNDYYFYHSSTYEELRGTSGSGVFSENGTLIGMIYEGNEETITVLSIKSILNFMNKQDIF